MSAKDSRKLINIITVISTILMIVRHILVQNGNFD